jgi:cytochrome c5
MPPAYSPDKETKLKRIMLAITATFLALSIYAVPPGTDEEIAQRLAPFGSICRAGEDCGTAAAVVASGPLSGEEVYNQFCFACHASGVGNAPILGDAVAWQPRVDKGMEVLMVSTLNGIGAMPAMGTCMNCSDDELGEAVTYMLDQL